MRLALAVSVSTWPLRRPLTTASGVITARTTWVVTVRDGEDTAFFGQGEAAPLPGYGGEDPQNCADLLARLPNIITVDEAFGALAGDDLGVLEPDLATTPCARAAVSGAVAAWRARRHGVTLARWFAGSAMVAGAVRSNGLLGDKADQAITSAVIKCKVSGDPLAVAARLNAVAMQHPQRRWRLDANGGWTAPHWEVLRAACPQLVIDYAEQPVAVEEHGGLARVRQLMAVAADEALRVPTDLAACIGRYDAVVLKPNWLGGWSPTRAVAERAAAAGLRVIISSALEGPIGHHQSVHIAAAIDPGANEYHGLDAAAWQRDPSPAACAHCGWITVVEQP